MRTLLLIVAGLLLAALASWWGGPSRRVTTAALFALAWLAVVGWNLRTGLSHGYSLREELPIQLCIYLVPLALAIWLAWKHAAK